MGEIVGTSAVSTATTLPIQRKSFYAAVRFWVFYSAGGNMVYCTSTDGLNWTTPTTVRACLNGYNFSIWFDGTYLHYAYAPLSVVGGSILYRRGTPEEGGTIAWSAVEQTAVAGAVGIQNAFPFVSVDSNGSAWIGYVRMDYPTYQPYVTKSSTTTGIWVTDVGFPFPLATATGDPTCISILPLTGGEMLAIYARSGRRANARLWNGAVWGIEISTIKAVWSYQGFCAVGDGNDAHIVFTSTSYNLIYAKYDYSSNSFIDEKLLTGSLPVFGSVISIDENNNLLVFWPDWQGSTVYYMIYTAENDTWGPVVKWKTEVKIRSSSFTCFYKQYSDYIGLVYMTGSYPAYAVKFNYITPEIFLNPKVVSNTLISSGSRHTTPEEGSVGTSLSAKRTRITRHITWVPVVITRA